MKLLKIKIKRENKNNTTKLTYPKEYRAKLVNVLAYETKDERLKRSDKDTIHYCICIVDDKVGNHMLKSDDITEITETEFKNLGDKWRPQKEIITNQNEVISLTAKAVRGETLTQKEKDALDPDKDEKGINKSQSFEEMFNNQKKKYE